MNLNRLYRLIKVEKENLALAKLLLEKFPDIANPQAVEIAEKSLNILIHGYKMAGGKRNV